MYTDVYICVYQRIYLLIKSPHTNVFTHCSRVYTFHSLAQQGCVGVFMSFPRNGTLMVAPSNNEWGITKKRSRWHKCARFSQFTPKSDVDWLIYYASQKPGPGEYEPKPVASRAGVTFSKFTPKGEIDKIQERAQELPGPSDYSSQDLRPVKRRSLGELKKILGAGADVRALTNKIGGGDFNITETN